MSNEYKFNHEGKDYVIDLDKAKELGLLKEDTEIKSFKAGDIFKGVFYTVCVIKRYPGHKYIFCGLNGDLCSEYSDGEMSYDTMLRLLNNPMSKYVFVKNINDSYKV